MREGFDGDQIVPDLSHVRGRNSAMEADSSLPCTGKSPQQSKCPQPPLEVLYDTISCLDPAQHELSVKVITNNEHKRLVLPWTVSEKGHFWRERKSLTMEQNGESGC